MADSITVIGLTAGEVWHFIDGSGGESTISQVMNSIGQPKTITLMALGWLAREGQVFIEEKGNDFKVTVKKY